VRYHCCDKRRLEVLRLNGTANAIEFLEVHDHAEPDLALRQRTLFVRLLRPGFTLGPGNILIDGGERIRVVAVEWAAAADDLPPGTPASLVDGIDDLARTLVVRTRYYGDFSRYTFRLRASSGSDQPPAGFDPILSSIEFSFKVECPSDYDCAVAQPCPPPPFAQPDIDYLAKDYPGFRRLMLDRLSLLSPGWSERSAADVGITLVELLAYAADNLSYRQDAIAGEAYLGTARRRISVRRHARLVDYRLHDGCNARVWVCFEVSDNDVALARHTPLLTRTIDLPTVLTPGSKPLSDALAAGAVTFEVAHDATLHADLNQLSFYTWGDQACCLPRGATRATLRDHQPRLRAGAVLVFQEVASPTTFEAQDADRAKRWAVRLSRVTLTSDPSGQLFDEPPVDAARDVTEIEWAAADALPFPLCLSVHERPGLEVSVALGNVVLADHGRSVLAETLGSVPAPTLRRAPAAAAAGACGHPKPEGIPVRFRPRLAEGPVTQGFDVAALLEVPLTDEDDASGEAWQPASGLLRRDPHEALPLGRGPNGMLGLTGTAGTEVTGWTPHRDLLASDGDAPEFVLETEDDGSAFLRFGDGKHGKRPETGTAFVATYRVGNGLGGNVGANAIAHVVSTAAGVFDVLTNPMPALGGIDPEPLDVVRRDAPEAFRTQERAVTAADYAAAAERRPEVQRAAATFRWTGSWYTVFVTADRLGGGPVDAPFEARLRRHLERFRMAGYDLEVDAPRFAALDVALHICVLPGYFRSEVLRAVSAELGSGVLRDGRLAIFHPDNFTFSQPVYLSQVIATAQAVEGVEAVSVTKFTRMAEPTGVALEEGLIRMGRLEIAQLANDPSFRERGRLTLSAGGGK